MIWARQMLAARRIPSAPEGSHVQGQALACAKIGDAKRLPDLLVFVVVCAIRSKRKEILRTCSNADDVMALFSSRRRQDLWGLLQGARKLMKSYCCSD